MFRVFLYFTVSCVLFPMKTVAAEDFSTCEQAYNIKAPTAYAICLEFANKRNGRAQRMIGDMFFFGWGDKITEDKEEARRWYRRAALNGDIDAKYNMGVMLDKGFGDIPPDPAEAVKWFRSAAKDGHSAAQLNLGNMYSRGEGIEQNEQRASQWYLRAAKQGDVVAQYNIGTRYAKGHGIDIDLVESYKWLLLAKQAGVTEAEASLQTLEKNMGPSDRAEARRLARSWKPIIESPRINYLSL